MVGPAPGSEPQPPSAAAEEALKRNTDCVYFLASPLTCKKGSECEYRHSEVARVNPRDCYFWLHGNCLNPKCSFRHPPLDGLLGTQTPTSAGPSLPQSQNVPIPIAPVPNASTKQGVPCIFFQKGFCLKGDWCPFLHGPNSMSNKGSLMPETATAAEPATFKKAVGGLDKFAQDKKVAPVNVAKPVKVSPQAKQAVEVEPALVRQNKRVAHTSGFNEFPGYKNVPSVANGNPRVQQPHLLDEPGSMNYKDAEEVSREPSPGFDVLVDDERRESDYYHSEDQYGISREHEARNEYNIGHSTDYDTIADVGSERYQDPLGYDSHEHFKGQHAWEHRASSEKMSGGSSYLERRPYARKDNLGQVDGLDLRHRLAKHNKANGLRSVINHEHARDRHAEDRSYQGFHREEQRVSRHESSLGSRLRGRLRIPGRSSSPTDRDIMSRNRGRLSPVRATSSHQGRIQDRVKGKVEESLSNGGKNHRDSHLRRHIMDDNSANFTGPKSLAELKNKKTAEHSGHHVTDQQALGKRKHLVLDGHQQSGDDLSFEGPKPLQEILKRKRGETSGVVSGGNSSNNEDNAEDNNNHNKGWESVNKTETEESSPHGRHSAPPPIASKLQGEDGTIIEDAADQESEAAYEQREGESDYEQVGGEEFEMYDGENGDAEGEEEYHDEDDDDDDFAKKMGVMYSEA